MRFFLIVLGLAVLFAIPLFIFGDRFDDSANKLREYDDWAGLIGIGLIVGDLFLPIPATAVMTALGYVYGTFIGGLFAGTGSFIAGSVGYLATRMMGRRAAVFLVGEKDLDNVGRFFKRVGGYAIAVSRPVPLLPEVVTCLAGMAGMRARPFFLALACGSLATGFVFAAVGQVGVEYPSLTLAGSILVPLMMWPVVQKIIRKREAADADA